LYSTVLHIVTKQQRPEISKRVQYYKLILGSYWQEENMYLYSITSCHQAAFAQKENVQDFKVSPSSYCQEAISISSCHQAATARKETVFQAVTKQKENRKKTVIQAVTKQLLWKQYFKLSPNRKKTGRKH